MQLRGLIYEDSGNVAVGTSKVIKVPLDGDVSVAVVPGASGSAEVYYTASPGAAIDGNTANWFAWTPGSVGSATLDTRKGPISGVKIVAATAACAYEFMQRRLA